MILETFPVGPLGCNCSVLADPATRHAVVVDPGGDFERIERVLVANSLMVVAIVHTHTHVDHVGATAPLQRHTGAEAHIHEADRFLYRMLPVQATLLGVPQPAAADVIGSLRDGGSLHFGSFELGVLHTPGHTPGSVCFRIDTGSGDVLFSGDTLFQRGVGRSDLWGGDGAQLMRSLEQRVMVLEDATRVIPGHGPETTIGDERALNPYL